MVLNAYTVWLMIKARNKFKNNKIVDIGDLSERLYGENAKFYMKGFLAFNNTLFLSVYVLFFGTQMDKLMCETFMVSECGNEKIWAALVNAILLPVLFIERLSDVGVFSGSVVALTVVSMSLIFYVCQDIYRGDEQYVLEKYKLEVP